MKLTSQQFKKYLNDAQDKFEYKRIEAVRLFVIQKKHADEISSIVNSPPGTIYNWTSLYKRRGIDGLLSKKKGGRRREAMSVEKEQSFLNQLVNDASDGIIVTALKIRLKLNNIISKTISRSCVYDILKRNKWRKIAPRPQNPKSSKDVREEFKSAFPKLVEEAVKTFAPDDKRPAKILFEDEGIFGRINELKNCWAPHGVRPIVKFQLVRQFDYVFATVNPGSGETFSLILPDADSQMMNLFLKELSMHYSKFKLIIVCDRAAWHKSKLLIVPENIRFIYLPAASPELNPVEHLWDHVRENFIANKIFDSLDSLEEVLEGAFKHIYYNPDSIKSLVSFSWIN
jgi:transposase